MLNYHGWKIVYFLHKLFKKYFNSRTYVSVRFQLRFRIIQIKMPYIKCTTNLRNLLIFAWLYFSLFQVQYSSSFFLFCCFSTWICIEKMKSVQTRTLVNIGFKCIQVLLSLHKNKLKQKELELLSNHCFLHLAVQIWRFFSLNGGESLHLDMCIDYASDAQ